jgi:phage terminase Nu1 subunit (DNA packaging protein)
MAGGDLMAYTGKGQIVNRTVLADIFGVAVNTVDAWVRSGCPVVQRGSRGKEWQFRTSDVAQWRTDQARDQAAGATLADEAELKRRKLAAETGKAELEFAQARGDVAPIREFERATAGLMAAIRQNVMQVPGRAVLQLLGEKDETRFKEVLRGELALALETAAEADLSLEDDEAGDE